MISVAIIGANGYVGSSLYANFLENPNYIVTAVTRKNYEKAQKQPFDILINSAMPAARFLAKNNPRKDFEETVKKTADLIYAWRFGKFVQISTVSARCQLNTVYGRHKAAAENICGFGDNLIVRLGPTYDRSLNKGVLVDMLHGKKVFVDGESRYCFTALEFVTSWIISNLGCSGIREVGSRNAIPLREVADYLGSKIDFEGIIDHQEIQNPSDDYPDVRAVFPFLDIMKKTNLKQIKQ